MADLKPCPFCGGEAEERSHYHTYTYDQGPTGRTETCGDWISSIECMNCGTKKPNAEAWNRRSLSHPAPVQAETLPVLAYTDKSWLASPSGQFVTKPHRSFPLALTDHSQATAALAQKDVEIAEYRHTLKHYRRKNVEARAERDAALAELTALREQAARDREYALRWKKAAESIYGRYMYPDRPGLGRGALDAWFDNNKEWEPEFDAAVTKVLGAAIAKEQGK